MKNPIAQFACILGVFILPALAPAVASAQTAQNAAAVTVVNAGPNGEIAQLDEADEIRVVFSEPMVALGRIPASVQAPFFKISPAVPGTFRWSGTTILIFTPDHDKPLPYATEFRVTVDSSAQAISGRRLASPYSFDFTTPTVRLLDAEWSRRGGMIDGNVVVYLRFNQPVRPAAIAAHATARFRAHEWEPPELPKSILARLNAIDPRAAGRFVAKVAATNAAAASEAPVRLNLASDWNKQLHVESPNLVVLETATKVPPESWVRVAIDDAVPSPAGRATPGKEQGYTLKLEPAFFVRAFRCSEECDPEYTNRLRFTRNAKVEDLIRATSVTDITTAGRDRLVPKAKSPAPRARQDEDETRYPTLEDMGYDTQPPARTYFVVVDGNLRAADGQALGYTWAGTVENWHKSAFTSFGDGHGVWEKSGGGVLPFYARNMRNVRQWAIPIAPDQLMPIVEKLQNNRFGLTPEGVGTPRALGVTADRIQSHGLDMSKALRPSGTGLVWAAVQEGDPIEKASPFRGSHTVRATLLQVTNLGIAVKDSPQNTLVFVTTLDKAAPVEGARVSIIRPGNTTAWTGTTGADGVAIAPHTPLRDQRHSDFAFIVSAEKDGDIAYVASDWGEGIRPWDFGVRYDLTETEPILRGSVFADRGVYRLGEEAHLKTILRHNTPAGIRPLAAGTRVSVAIRDSRDKVVDERVVIIGAWSSAEWSLTLPGDGALGTYSMRAVLESDKPPAPKTEARDREAEFEGGESAEVIAPAKVVRGSFLVAAYRRPDFRVDVKVSGDPLVAGAPLTGTITARYLFGAPLGGRPVQWTLRRVLADPPASVYRDHPREVWSFASYTVGQQYPYEVARNEATLPKNGELTVTLDTAKDAGGPSLYTLEADVEDVSRQHIANRASIVVNPAPWYVGLRRTAYFVQQKDGLKTAVVVVGLDGRAVPGVPIEVTLTQTQWKSARRSQGNGYYSWETQSTSTEAGRWKIVSAADPVPLDVSLPAGGYFTLQATARDDQGHSTTMSTNFYGLGPGYTAWARHDHNRIDLVPDRQTYRPGDTARVMIQSPWEQATALVTTERESIRTHRQFALASTQQTISIPITEDDIPNLFVSVLLVKGRTLAAPDGMKQDEDVSDPGKPAFRLGYVELKIENVAKRLAVSVSANKAEYRPANAAKVSVEVKDATGNGAASEVTLWAVDYGVLSLTGYKAPDLVDAVYMEKALQVRNEDNRQRVVSRRVLTPKGGVGGDGGGEAPGQDTGVGAMRRDFRVLAFWLGSVVTDAAGHASVDVKLPESLTTYRIMAVAGDLQSRFGSGDSEVRVTKPVTLKATFPRFLAVGDRAFFGAVVTSQLKETGSASVTIKSLDPQLLEVTGAATQTTTLPAGGAVEVRFDAAGRAAGRARVQMTVRVGAETDAFEDVIPVEVLVSPETVAAYGEAGDGRPIATEGLTIPDGVVPAFGGLHLELASTALVGLGVGASYLIEYPYGCGEQRGSRALAMLLAADLGGAFRLPGIEPGKLRPAVQGALKELQAFQCGSGGFAYWPGACWSTSPYLTAYLLHVFQVATDLKYDVDAGTRKRAYAYLEGTLSEEEPRQPDGWAGYTAWQAYALKVLVEGGHDEDANVDRLYEHRDKMPVFALAYLLDALTAKGQGSTDERVADLQRRIMNAILPEAGSAHVEELDDPELPWFWDSNVTSTATVLNSLAKAGVADAPMRQLVRWMLAVRKKGRWSNTYENGLALESLVRYYRKYEAVVPDFLAHATLDAEELARAPFKGRSTEAVAKDLPMDQVLSKGKAGSSHSLTFSRDGAGTLFYTARLRYAADALYQQGLDAGIGLERSYAPYVESGQPPPPVTNYKAGDLVRITLTLHLTKERRFVAVTDPLPAGFEPVETWFATTASSLAPHGRMTDEEDRPSWFEWWGRGGFDHVERHDDRVNLFATRLAEGTHTFTYVARATTAGTFRTAPAHAEEMYEPEVFGRTGTAVIEIKR